LNVFTFFNKKPRSINLESLVSDMHSHLIPGIDDGAPDEETSLRLIAGLTDLGYKKIITTPHINADVFRNTPAIIGEGQAAVLRALQQKEMKVEFRAAAEYLMDDQFAATVSDGGSFLTIKDNLVLVELSFIVPALNLKDMLFQLQLNGYQPILAHPERYLYFAGNKAWYDQLRDSGCYFQLNLLSFADHYGREARDLALYLVKKGYVDYLGTDLHHSRHLELLRFSQPINKAVQQLHDKGLLRNSTL
jgi:protein-tyrosine phosphatase